MTGCTFGKGNLIHKDYGKNGFTFIRRSDDKAIRITPEATAWGQPDPQHQALMQRVQVGGATAEEEQQFHALQRARAERILAAPLADLFTVTLVTPTMPARARLNKAITCAGCGEAVMETRSRLFRSEFYCIPCFEARDRR